MALAKKSDKNLKLAETLAKLEKEQAELPPPIPFFMSYDPHLTFSGDGIGFVSHRGSKFEMDDDAEGLFNLGKDVFREFCADISRDDFILAVNNYKDFVKDLAQTFSQHEANGLLVIGNRDELQEFDWEGLEDVQVLGIAWQYFRSDFISIEDLESLLREAFLMGALILMDEILISRMLGSPYIKQVIDVSGLFNNALSIGSKNEGFKKARRDLAFKAAVARLQKDPKEIAMQQIEKEHQALKSHQRTRGYLAPFARAMQEKYPVIESATSIERRIRKLRAKE